MLDRLPQAGGGSLECNLNILEDFSCCTLLFVFVCVPLLVEALQCISCFELGYTCLCLSGAGTEVEEEEVLTTCEWLD